MAIVELQNIKIQSAVLIAVDWGSSNRSAYLLDSEGNILDTRADTKGMATVEAGRFEPEYKALISNWMDSEKPIPALLSGMAGASTGWKEAPYCTLPASIEDLANSLERVPSDLPAWIVPGLSTRDLIGAPDVIRGEEVQAFHAIDDSKHEDCLIVMPGTHSKWMKIQAGRIVDFRTYMTGDMHAALLNHTIVSKLVTHSNDYSSVTFLNAVEIGNLHGDDLLHLVFGARSKVLFGELDSDHISDYLSGLLIGAEIKSALNIFSTGDQPIKLLANPQLTKLFSAALKSLGQPSIAVKPEAVGRTYIDIARHAKLI